LKKELISGHSKSDSIQFKANPYASDQVKVQLFSIFFANCEKNETGRFATPIAPDSKQIAIPSRLVIEFVWEIHKKSLQVMGRNFTILHGVMV
jgi:hypothetical protein